MMEHNIVNIKVKGDDTILMIMSKYTEVLKLVSRGQMDFYGSNGIMTDRFFTFNAYGYEICNPFRDELNMGEVDPLNYYGDRFLESDMPKDIKMWVDKYTELTSEQIAEMILRYVTYNNLKDRY